MCSNLYLSLNKLSHKRFAYYYYYPVPTAHLFSWLSNVPKIIVGCTVPKPLAISNITLFLPHTTAVRGGAACKEVC